MARLLSHARIPLYRNAYALTLSAAATSGLGMVYWVLAARYYATEVVGLNSALVSSMLFFSEVSRLNLGNALIRFVPAAGRATGRLVGVVYVISVTLATLCGLAVLLAPFIRAAALRVLGTPASFLVWFVLALLVWCVYALQENVLTALGQSLWVLGMNSIFAAAKIGLLVVFAGVSPRFGIFASWNIPAFALLIPVGWLIFRRFIPRHVATTTDRAAPIVPTQIASYVAGDYLGHVFFLASSSLLPLLVLQQAGASATAYFYQPWVIASSLQLVLFNMATSLTVEAAREPTKLRLYARQMLRQMARLLAPVVLVVLLGAPFILRIFGEDYAAEGATLLRLLVLSALPYMVITLYFSMARVRRQVAGIVLVQGVLGALTLGLSYILLRRYGITGVGIAWLSTCTGVAVVLLLARVRLWSPERP